MTVPDYSDTGIGRVLMISHVHWNDGFGWTLPHTTEVHMIVKALVDAGFDPDAPQDQTFMPMTDAEWEPFAEAVGIGPTQAKFESLYRECHDPDCEVAYAYQPNDTHFHYVGDRTP